MAVKILSKKLTIADMNRLSVKIRSLEYFPPFGEGQVARDIRVEDEEGKVWTFRLIICKGRHRKPVLGAGWLQFVRSKNLEPGFKVQFFMEVEEETGEVKYRIKMKKPVTLFNIVIGHAPCTRAG